MSEIAGNQSNSADRMVLSCIDGSSVSEAVCDYSSWIAAKVNAPLKLLHTIEQRVDPAVSDFSGAIGLGSQEDLLNELTEVEQSRSRLMIKKGQLMLKAAKQRVLAAGIENTEVCQRHGNLTESLIDFEEGIRVLVVGIRGEAHEQAHEQAQEGLGTQLETVIRAIHKPILVVNKSYSEPKNVMLAYDGSEACDKALTMLASSPLFKDIPCHIVHVGSDGEKLLLKASEQLTKSGLAVTTAQLNGKIELALANYQTENKIDLTVMGAFTHNRFRDFLLGSFTAKMLAATQRPLLLLR